ncbi:MAG: xanthine dehydrogenase family protein molybdopterin-binding subunit [Rhodospirillaceae bacterium]
MSAGIGVSLPRREFLATGGALILSFAIRPPMAAAQQAGAAASGLPGSLKKSPLLDSWIRIAADGSVTVFTGKAELGQGIATALQQIAAEQLALRMERITMVTADTERTPDEGYTAGSNSMKDSGTAILNAAAQVREILLNKAAKRFGVPPGRLTAQGGAVLVDDGRRVGYGELVADQMLHVNAQGQSKLKDPGTHILMGKPVARVDIPRKLTGGASYVHDLRLPGMVHARVVRPPGYEARLKSVDTGVAAMLPGVLKIVRDGRYLAVVAEREYQAVQAARALGDAAIWDAPATLPPQRDIYDHLLRLPSQDTVIHGDSNPPVTAPGALEATFRRAYQIHGAIGPSCAVGLLRDRALTVWTHSQGVFPLRAAIAEMVKMPLDKVHCIHMEGSGCYGHNGADDAGADAALIAVAFPDRPVRVQWMRQDEHAWEPFGPAMVAKARATLDGDGRIASWQYDVWSNTHSTRPGKAGNLAPAWLLESPFTPPPPEPLPLPDGGGDRNAIPLYTFPNARITHHFIADMPLRVSALRALGAYTNVFAIESFLDQLAGAAKVDPVEFRLRHLEDPRARDVVRMAAERFGWTGFQRLRNHGRGFAFARYKNHAAYAAVAMEVEVDRDSGEVRIGRVVAAVDSGAAVNPDGIRNQIEGGILQSISWTLYEAVTWEATHITSRDWGRYPILRFPHLPKSVEAQVIDRPGQPFLGTGEAAQGPAAAALANAVADAVGVRIRDIPLDRERIRTAVAP